MQHNFPVSGVTISQTAVARKIEEPAYCGENFRVNRDEFEVMVDGVGSFYAAMGKKVEITPFPDADPEWVRLCLNSRVLAAILHQRKIINFHASSLIHNGKGIMILGETCAGKSSLAASFALDGADFLSDDLTPVIFKKSKPYLWPIPGSIKINENTVEQLNISRKKLTAAENGTGKHYLHIDHAGVKDHLLHTILKIEIGNNNTTEFYKPEPAGKFSLLRSEICSWEMLAGMPETEAEYLHQLLQIVQQVNFVRVLRSVEIEIQRLHAEIADYLKIFE